MPLYFSKYIRGFKPYLRLMRVPAPIGVALLLFPCWWGLALGTACPSLFHMGLFALGAFVMRSAGCIINDWVDREVDREVHRTRDRPLAAGTVSLRGALLLLIGLLSMGLFIVSALPFRAQGVSLLLAGGMVVYPFLKRVTYFPQLFLGMIFNGGLLVGWLTVQPQLSPMIIALYSGAIFWTLGYDTLYALQDIEDDRKIGVKSLALWLGPRAWTGIWVFYLCFCGIWGALAFMTHQWCLGSVLVGIALRVSSLYPRMGYGSRGPELAVLFRKNIWIGVWILSGIFLDNVLKWGHVH